jgi:hypothetical protein
MENPPLHNLCSQPALVFPTSAWYSRKKSRAWSGSTESAPDFLAALRRATGGRDSSSSYVRFARRAALGAFAALTFGDLFGTGRALINGVAWKFLDPRKRHPFSINGIATLAEDMSLAVALAVRWWKLL